MSYIKNNNIYNNIYNKMDETEISKLYNFNYNCVYNNIKK